MPSLTIRNIPEELLQRLRDEAKGQRRSINQEALTWLESQAVRMPSFEERQKRLEEAERRRKRLQKAYPNGFDPVEAMIEDRRARGFSARGLPELEAAAQKLKDAAAD